MKKIAALLIVLSSLTTSLYANELTANEREEGIKVIEKIREKMRKEEEEARIAKEKQIIIWVNVIGAMITAVK